MLAFDTHKQVKALEHAGADPKLAEAVVEIVGVAVSEGVSSKHDVEQAVTTLRGEIKALESSLIAKIQDMRNDLTVRFGMMLAASVGVVTAIIKWT